MVHLEQQEQSVIQAIFPGPVRKWVEEASEDQKTQVLSLIGTNFIADNITSVWAINNYFLEAMYLLKKAEIECRFGRRSEEKLLLHVTKEDAVDSIISDNFDWSRVSRSKFGLGTSFSDDAVYCHRYSNFNIGHDRAVFVTKVLVTQSRQSIKNEVIPPPEYDTIVGNGGKVFVKFCESEYFPVFVAFYNVSDVDPADIKDDYERQMHLEVLEGVKRERLKIYKNRGPRKQGKMLISPNVPKATIRPPLKQQNVVNPRLEAAKRNALRDSFKHSLPVAHSRTGRTGPAKSFNTCRTSHPPRNTHQSQPITSQNHYSKGRNVSSRPPTPIQLEEDKEPPGCCSKFMDGCYQFFSCLCFC